MRPHRVLIADDDPYMQQALHDVLVADDRFMVLGIAASGDDLMRLHETDPADLVLLDVRMPGGGPRAARRLADSDAPPVIVAVSAGSDVITVVSMVRAGASGYFAKGRLGRALPEMIARCADGQVILAVSNATAVLRALADSELAPLATDP